MSADAGEAPEGAEVGPRFVVLTLFPSLVEAYVSEGIIGRALSRNLARVETIDIRDHATDKYRSVDDDPFGGGAGMVMKPDVLARAIESAGPVERRIFVSPKGRPMRQRDAEAWSRCSSILLLCGRYEGIDERVREALIDDTVSIGDYVLTGGELAALVVLDATLRLVPGVLGNADSARYESHSGDGLLEHPHYTRPAEWRGRRVPEVLLSGHHARIEEWRRRASLRQTAAVRPELLNSASLTDAELEYLSSLRADGEES